MLVLRGIGGRRRRGRQRMRWLDGIMDSMDVSLSELRGSWWWTGRAGVLRFMGSQRVGHNWATELNWVLTRIVKSLFSFTQNPLHNRFVAVSGTGAHPGSAVCTMVPLVPRPLAHARSRGMLVGWTGPQHSRVRTIGQALALGSVAEKLNVLWLWL